MSRHPAIDFCLTLVERLAIVQLLVGHNEFSGGVCCHHLLYKVARRGVREGLLASFRVSRYVEVDPKMSVSRTGAD